MEMQILSPLMTGVVALGGGVLGYFLARKVASSTVADAERRAETIIEAAQKQTDTLTRAAEKEAAAITSAAQREAGSIADAAKKQADALTSAAQKEVATIRKAAEVEGKEALRADREALDQEIREKNNEIRDREKQLRQREDEADRQRQRLERKEEDLEKKLEEAAVAQRAVEAELTSLDARRGELEAALERIANMSVEEARQKLLAQVEDKAKLDAARIGREYEEQAKENAEREAQKILATVVNRYSGEYIAERTVSVVQIPDDQMKGRIIGREGRNIRTFEMITGVDVIIDDTPEHVIISCHNGLRREVARQTLLRLIEDGRIQPGRIEELYQSAIQEIEKNIREAGQQAVFDLGLQGMHPELIRIMGLAKFRTSYSQNVLLHSSEVAYFCGMMAAELGLDEALARRCGFLHDIGKAIDHEFEGSHQAIGAELCKKYGESEDVVRAVGEHHDDPPGTIYGVLVQSADTLSAARPGARRETVTNYIKRMEDLERIATQHSEVTRAFAIQSGRELRVMLDAERTTDDNAYHLSKSVASQIEAELKYPGQIKVTVLREMRATAYAK